MQPVQKLVFHLEKKEALCQGKVIKALNSLNPVEEGKNASRKWMALWQQYFDPKAKGWDLCFSKTTT